MVRAMAMVALEEELLAVALAVGAEAAAATAVEVAMVAEAMVAAARAAVARAAATAAVPPAAVWAARAAVVSREQSRPQRADCDPRAPRRCRGTSR